MWLCILHAYLSAVSLHDRSAESQPQADHAIYETDIPDSWIGHTLQGLAVRQKYRINILAVRQNDIVDAMPGPNYTFRDGDRVILLGNENDVQKFLRF